MGFVQKISEGLARRTSRRGLFSRGADTAFGALIGAAAGVATRPGPVGARHTPTHTVCAFPGPPCACEHCLSSGVCAKPCIIYTFWYTSGCWTSIRTDDDVQTSVTCCDCDCGGPNAVSTCGCGSDHHNHPDNCPDGTADS